MSLLSPAVGSDSNGVDRYFTGMAKLAVLSGTCRQNGVAMYRYRLACSSF